MIRAFSDASSPRPATLLVATQAQAELTLCNRTSFRMEAAIGIEKRANVLTCGWYRLDPGQCRQVLGPLDADMVYLHGRTPSVYGAAPLPQNGDADFCIRNGDFEIAYACTGLFVEPAGPFQRGQSHPIRRKEPPGRSRLR